MSFRTIEISQAAELHIQKGQLKIASAEGVAVVPVEDVSVIMLHGANIRLSSMDLSILSQNKVAVMTLDEKYLPTAIVLPFAGNSRQAKLMHAQTELSANNKMKLWKQIIQQKICNQSRALSILGLNGAEAVATHMKHLDEENVDYKEALAAKDYFSFYHAGLNRRSEDPINSRLNYGYAVVRSYIARDLVSSGFHPTFGLHHANQLNAFNLADDLIEPFRALVDLVVYYNKGANIILSKAERRNLSHVLYNACIVDGTKMNVMTAVDLMVESLKRIMVEESDENLKLPVIIPVESLEGITE